MDLSVITRLSISNRFHNEKGIVIPFVAVLTIILVMFMAFAIDLGYLFVIRNELKNAADAGALAGAQVLYNDYGIAVNEGANLEAYNVAVANKSQNTAVDVHWDPSASPPLNNGTDIERGHWSFANSFFTANASLVPVDLWNVSTAELDANLDFINAVRVKVRREDTPAWSFFSRIFGYGSYFLSQESVAYIGFAGTLGPGEADQPIAICQDKILIDGEYSCNVGRMINSGDKSGTNETGGWTDFNQAGDPCKGGTNKTSVDKLVCGSGNPGMVLLGDFMATSGGEIQAAFDHLEQCWIDKTGKTKPWNMTLPVITCPSNNVGTCENVVGTVNVNLIWIVRSALKNQIDDEAPYEMENPDPEGQNWSNSDPNGQVRWDSFVTHFNLRRGDNKLATFVIDDGTSGYTAKTLYFLPDCTPHELKGNTGGQNFGVLARIPVLVK